MCKSAACVNTTCAFTWKREDNDAVDLHQTPKHFLVSDEGRSLVIKAPIVKNDAGKYKCFVHKYGNLIGTAKGTLSVVDSKKKVEATQSSKKTSVVDHLKTPATKAVLIVVASALCALTVVWVLILCCCFRHNWNIKGNEKDIGKSDSSSDSEYCSGDKSEKSAKKEKKKTKKRTESEDESNDTCSEDSKLLKKKDLKTAQKTKKRKEEEKRKGESGSEKKKNKKNTESEDESNDTCSEDSKLLKKKDLETAQKTKKTKEEEKRKGKSGSDKKEKNNSDSDQNLSANTNTESDDLEASKTKKTTKKKDREKKIKDDGSRKTKDKETTDREKAKDEHSSVKRKKRTDSLEYFGRNAKHSVSKKATNSDSALISPKRKKSKDLIQLEYNSDYEKDGQKSNGFCQNTNKRYFEPVDFEPPIRSRNDNWGLANTEKERRYPSQNQESVIQKVRQMQGRNERDRSYAKDSFKHESKNDPFRKQVVRSPTRPREDEMRQAQRDSRNGQQKSMRNENIFSDKESGRSHDRWQLYSWRQKGPNKERHDERHSSEKEKAEKHPFYYSIYEKFVGHKGGGNQASSKRRVEDSQATRTEADQLSNRHHGVDFRREDQGHKAVHFSRIKEPISSRFDPRKAETSENRNVNRTQFQQRPTHERSSTGDRSLGRDLNYPNPDFQQRTTHERSVHGNTWSGRDSNHPNRRVEENMRWQTARDHVRHDERRTERFHQNNSRNEPSPSRGRS